VDANPALSSTRHRVLDTLPVAIWSGPFPRGAASEMTAGIELLVGYSREEWLGHPDLWGTLIVEEDRPTTAAVEDLAAGASMTVEYRLRNRSGELVWIRDLIGRSADGERLRGVMVRIDREIEATRRAERLQWTLQRVSDSVSEVQFTLPPDGELFVTRAYDSLTGRSRAHALDPDLGARDLVHEDDLPRLDAAIEKLLSGTNPVELTLRLIRDDGNLRWVFARAQRDVEDNGRSWIHGIARDVTEQRLRDEAQREAQRLKSLGTVTGNIAHDFNNMLVAVLGNASLALDRVDPGSDLGEMLADVVAGAERGAALCRQILTFAGRSGRGSSWVDLGQAVRELVPLLRASALPGTNLELRLPDEPIRARVDPIQLDQLLQNLIVNASEACVGAGGRVRISVERIQALPERTGGLRGADPWAGPAIRMRVEDSGPGIVPEVSQRMLEPFFSTKARAGRGLGLSTVFGILRAHGGVLAVGSSEDLGGACFDAMLPLEKEPSRDPEQTFCQQNLELGAPLQVVLVVDDEEEVRRTARRALESAGHLVLEAADLASARRTLSPAVTLVLLDQNLPDGDGASWFLELEAQPSRPAVLLSSGAQVTEIPLSVGSLERLEFLGKPYHPRALLGAVDRLARSQQDLQ
jgi:two-component system cell cycle sensor histidine kinase/response regulator CckA